MINGMSSSIFATKFMLARFGVTTKNTSLCAGVFGGDPTWARARGSMEQESERNE